MNPYTKTIIDEASGMELPNDLYEAFEAGRKVGVVKLRRLTDGEICNILDVAVNEKKSMRSSRVDIIQAQLDQVKKDNPNVKFEEL